MKRLWTSMTAAQECQNAWYCAWLAWWHAQPENQDRRREIERQYIAAMQADPRKD